MNDLGLIRIKLKILFRKILLNLLLLILSPRNKFIVALSQNLDKYIFLHQKQLFLLYYYDNTDKL
jgi:hypothetical protein